MHDIDLMFFLILNAFYQKLLLFNEEFPTTIPTPTPIEWEPDDIEQWDEEELFNQELEKQNTLLNSNSNYYSSKKGNEKDNETTPLNNNTKYSSNDTTPTPYQTMDISPELDKSQAYPNPIKV